MIKVGTKLGAVLVFGMAVGACAPDPTAPLETQTQEITHGERDLTHPYVGLVQTRGDIYDLDGNLLATDRHLWRCSGTVMSPTVVLTAGHCVYDEPTRMERMPEHPGDEIVVPRSAAIYLGTDIAAGPTAFPSTGFIARGRLVPHPGYDNFATFPNTSDLGLVTELSPPIALPEYGELAGAGLLDSWARAPRNDTFLQAVGYGLQSIVPLQQALERKTALEHFVNMTGGLTDGYNLQTADTPRALPAKTARTLSEDPNCVPPATGGTCFGDSGGPQFLPGTRTVVAVTSFGLSPNCTGLGFHYRTDIPSAQGFILPALAP